MVRTHPLRQLDAAGAERGEPFGVFFIFFVPCDAANAAGVR